MMAPLTMDKLCPIAPRKKKKSFIYSSYKSETQFQKFISKVYFWGPSWYHLCNLLECWEDNTDGTFKQDNGEEFI